MRALITAAALLVLLAASARAEVLVYKTVGEKKLQLHVDHPPGWKAGDRRPAILFFFGGGWTRGNVEAFRDQAAYFARRGMVAARADYRVRSRDGVAPDECVRDARSAVRYMKRNAERLGIDPGKLVTSGGSAGGHLAACAMIAESVETEGDDLSVSTMPRAMVLFNPALDFTSLPLIGRIRGDADLALKITPTVHLTKDSPPALLFFGTEDALKKSGDDYVARAKAAGARAEMFVAEGEGHGFFNRPPWKERTIAAADRFLVSLGLLEGQPAVRVPEGESPMSGRRPRLPEPDVADVRYGPHAQDVLDLWLARSDAPTPFVIYYHGGGFRGGDKRSLDPSLLAKLLDAGISVAAVNYRLSGTAPFPAQMRDSARALQHLRHYADLHNLDPKRVGATGGSAGAGISLWLLFHDDLADPESEDPVSRESTRISAAVVFAAQSSYDPRFIRKLFDTDEVDGALIPFFGMDGPEDVDDPKFHPLFEEASPINHATADDGPVLLWYSQPNRPLPRGSTGREHIHHPRFGEVLKEKLEGLGVECRLLLREDHPRPPIDEYLRFFVEKLR